MWVSFKYLVIPAVMVLPFITAAQSNFSLLEASKSLPHLYGKKDNASYLCVIAGDRLYSIGGLRRVIFQRLVFIYLAKWVRCMATTD